MVMPISTAIPIRPYSQQEFGEIAFEVVGHAFDVHSALGKKFHESVYRRTLQQIIGTRSLSEVAITVSHGSFLKYFYVDLLVDSGCPFELKATSTISPDHIRQLIQYLMLLDLRHGKLINFGGEKVEHRFVNCQETQEQRRRFTVSRHSWGESETCLCFEATIVELVVDWGTGLSRSLYEEACVHFFGVTGQCSPFVETFWHDKPTGRQPMKMLRDGFAFDVTCKRDDLATYASHLRKCVVNTNLEAILWANINSGTVRLEKIGRER